MPSYRLFWLRVCELSGLAPALWFSPGSAQPLHISQHNRSLSRRQFDDLQNNLGHVGTDDALVLDVQQDEVVRLIDSSIRLDPLGVPERHVHESPFAYS